jgi:ABC-type uncharacterized transport system substrate-binding protein
MKKYCVLTLLMLSLLMSPGCGKSQDSADNKSKSATRYRIGLIHYSEYTVSDFEGKIRKGMGSMGLTEGKDYEIRKLAAQNDIATLNSIIDAVKADKPDLIIAFHAQALYAAVNKIKDRPIIFSIVSNPYILGAGKSDSEHLPNVTGIYYVPPTEALLEAISKCRPKIRKLGLLFQVGDAESSFQAERVEEIAGRYDIGVETVGFNTVAEIQESINTLADRKVDGVMMNYDSYFDIIFPLLAHKSKERKIPFFSYGHDTLLASGPVIVASKYTEKIEVYFAEMITKIRNGEKPGAIPFVSNKDRKSEIFINMKKARELGMTIPEELKREASKTIGE